MQPEEIIDCIDCGGRCHLLSKPDEDGKFWPGDIVAYRCADCRDRWDLVLPGAEDAGPSAADFTSLGLPGALGGVERDLA